MIEKIQNLRSWIQDLEVYLAALTAAEVGCPLEKHIVHDVRAIAQAIVAEAGAIELAIGPHRALPGVANLNRGG